MAYPSRPVRDVLPQFQGTATTRQTRDQRDALRAFVAQHYPAGYSLRVLAELTGRSQTAIRRALDETGLPRRGPGAPRVTRPG